MIGTEKQVEWAEKIQSECKDDFTLLVKDALRGPLFKAHSEWRSDLVKAYEQAWNDQEASWWIEHRHNAHIAVQDKARAIFNQMHP